MENVYIIMEESTPFGDVEHHTIQSIFLSKENAEAELEVLRKKFERVQWIRYYLVEKGIADA